MSYTSRETYDFISRQTGDPIVEWKTCKISNQPFPIYQSDLDFYEKISPTFNGKKFNIPTPTLCPEERQRRRLARRNERTLYRRKSDFSGVEMISIYSPDKPYTIYSAKERRSDQRNPIDYGRNFDGSRPFFEQFNELLKAVPRLGLINMNTVNAEYCNYAENSKNCYLAHRLYDDCENILYSYRVTYQSSHSMDLYMVNGTSFGYELVDCRDCYKCFYGYKLTGCRNCLFSYNLENCHDCVFCQNLSNQNYCISNTQYEKEAYFKQLENIKSNTLSHNQDKYYTLLQHSFQKNLNMLNSEACIGDVIYNSKDVVDSFNCINNEGVRYSVETNDTKQGYDLCGGVSELTYEAVASDGALHTGFGNTIWRSDNVLYSDNCHNSSHLFGCNGLRNKQYCILNKQYTKEEYEKMVVNIIEQMKESGEWGEFFPPSLSPFGYNETVAQEYFPLMKDEALHKNYKRSDYSSDPKIPENAELLSPLKLTDEERKALVNDDTITQKVIICKDSGRPFTIQKLELEFYRKMGLPLPKQHPDIRHEARMKQRPGRTLHLRTCDKCKKEIVSVYPAEETRKVYCEECYKQEVYG